MRALLEEEAAAFPPHLPQIQDREWKEGLELYNRMLAIGLDYGESFRRIARVRANDGIAEVELRPPETWAVEAKSLSMEWLHPAILDAGLQSVLACLPEQSENNAEIYLPVGFRRVRFHGRFRRPHTARARVQSEGGNFSADVQLFDHSNQLLIDIQGLRLRPVRRGAFAKNGHLEPVESLLYCAGWQPKPLIDSNRAAKIAAIPAPLPLSISELSKRATNRWGGLSEQHSLAGYSSLAPQLDALCTAYATVALTRLGWELVPGQPRRADTLATELEIVPSHERMFHRVLQMLEEDGILSRNEEYWAVQISPPPVVPASMAERMLLQWPLYKAEISMTARCGSHLAAVFRGASDPMELLFPSGSLRDLEAIYHRAPFAQAYNGLVAGVIADTVAAFPASRTLRILEIGAGTGGTTAMVLPHLPSDRTEYIYTDISPLFLARAEDRFAEYPFVQYRLLNIDKDPTGQGFPHDTFDLVIASNVLHATEDLRQTMLRVSSLAAPGGLLVMVEGISRQRWVDLIFGLTEGWWKFTDRQLRPSYPLLSTPQWRTLLNSVGFPEVIALSGDDKSEAIFEQAVILAKRSLEDRAAPQPKNKPLWLIFADHAGLAARTAARLEEAGYECLFVSPGQAFNKLANDRYEISPANDEEYLTLLDTVLGDGRKFAGIVHLWSVAHHTPESAVNLTIHDVDRAQLIGCRSILNLVKAISASSLSKPPRLWLITRGAQPDRCEAVDPASATILGLGRVIALEYPELSCTRIDLSWTPATHEADNLFQEFVSPDDEREVAYRDGVRHGRRLDRFEDRSSNLESPSQARTLVLSRPGELDSLAFQTTVRRPPGPGEVEIAVCATGLNFRDLLVALGMYPDPAAQLGGECSGIVSALGSEVDGLRVGDPVLAIASNSFASYAIALSGLTVPKPTGLSFEEAAAIPAVFLTSHYALRTLARLRQGETVLIHSAAGGVGLAAVQLAQRAGAVIFGTAGTEEKRRYLASIGVQHVMDSRATTFAEEILQATGGRGVDVVLNSLSGDAVESSIRALAPDGRFVEIGKRDIWSDARFRTVRQQAQYFVIDMAAESARNPGQFGQMLRDLAAEFEAGALVPIPRRTFGWKQVGSAFRLMSRAAYIGKIVVTQRPDAWRTSVSGGFTLRADGTYLITGGLGGLGLLIADWMIERGARHLVLMGRHEPSPTARKAIDRMISRGARVSVVLGDVSVEADVVAMLAKIYLEMPALRGIVHAAGLLDDGALHRQDWQRFQKVMAAKVTGSLNLHQRISHIPLDFFLLFSSAASMLGTPGQSNHAAANAFIDSLAHLRRSSGLPALAINWGVWTRIGAAAKRNVAGRMPIAGLRAIAPEQGLAILETLLDRGECQVGAFGMDWDIYAAEAAVRGPEAERLTGGRDRTLRLERTTQAVPQKRGSPASASLGHLDRIRQAQASRRVELLTRFVEDRIFKALGLDPSRPPDRSRPLQELGLDSLLAVELRNLIGNDLGLPRRLPATFLFDYPSIDAIANYLAGELLPPDDRLPAAEVLDVRAELAEVAILSDEEAETMLLKELNEN